MSKTWENASYATPRDDTTDYVPISVSASQSISNHRIAGRTDYLAPGGTVTRTPKGYQRASPATPHPSSTPKTDQRGNATSSSPFRNGPPTGTPSGRAAAIDKVFKEMANKKAALPPVTPNRVLIPEKPTPRRVVVVCDSDEDEDEEMTTDIEPFDSPTKGNYDYRGPFPVSSDSSQSSVNSLFSDLSISKPQSAKESLPPRRTYPKAPVTPKSQPEKSASQRTSVPTFISDMFTPASSPNVTHRTAQRPKPIPSHSERNLVKSATTPQTVLNFANSLFGTHLECAVIAHSDRAQKLFDDNKIEWGIQYELARGVSSGMWTWDDVCSRIMNFTGSNEQTAGKVCAIMLERPSLDSTKLGIWKELDREQGAIIENKGRGLGLMGEWQGSANWYGGQVQQLVRIVKDQRTYKLILEPMKRDRSHRFARFYGSRRFLQLGIPDDLLKNENDQVKTFLKKKFLLCGRIFVPFHSKEGHLYMVETNENVDRTEQSWCGDQFRMPFRDFINWHNPLREEKNHNQVISKYITRFALGLSTSVPVLEFEEHNIFFIDDLTSSEWPEGKKNPPANMLMTDGCGFINHAALHAVVKYLGYESIPAGVQGRLGGSKGLWILHPTDDSSDPKIWIRTSQDKIAYSTLDRAHRILDLLEPSRPSASVSLTAQSIVNVFANGVPGTALVRMMEEGLENEIGPLLEWDKPYAMVFLWDAINKLGNVSGSRAQRLATSFNRALGLQKRDWGRDVISSDARDLQVVNEPPTYSGRNPYSGAPLGLHESAMELIQAGFHPASNKQLHSKMESVINKAIEASVSKYRIPIEESLSAFIVPDPLGVLKEGEIYYKFSRPRKDPRTSMLTHVLEGDVIIGRYPIRLPSDMQKAKAVNYRELDKWPDVIIVSTQGKRSIASLLADGDMDGDDPMVIWDPEIVKYFDTKPFTNPPTDFYENNFDRSVETVGEFCHKAGLLSEREANEEFQDVVLANLTESNVGLYSFMHENCAVMYGYDNEKSVRLAYIFATLLDSSKSGYRLKPGILQKDLRTFGKSNNPSAPHPGDILAILSATGQKKGEELITRYKSIESSTSEDQDLLLPYKSAMDYALEAHRCGVKIFNDEVQRIRSHVDAVYDSWRQAIRDKSAQGSPTKPSAKAKQKGSKKSDQEDVSLTSARAYVQPLQPDIILTRNLEEVKASYAYTINKAFGFSVAFEELCRIKARASPGGHAPNLRIFDEAKSFSSSFLRALNRCEEEQRVDTKS